MKKDIKSKCYNPNDLIEKERLTNLQLSKANKEEIINKQSRNDLKRDQDALKEDQNVLKEDQDVLKNERKTKRIMTTSGQL